MNSSSSSLSQQTGFSMIEVLVTLIILLVGLLGMAGLMIQSQRSEMESYQRVQALILLQDMAARINTNRNVASCYAFTNATNGTPYLGTGSTLAVTACAAGTATQNAQVASDLGAWQSMLLGAAESSGGNVGALLNGRGCISYDGTNLLAANNGTSIPGTGIYTISVAWQGLSSTFANTSAVCGQGLYGNETNRRVVSLTLRIGSVSNSN